VTLDAERARARAAEADQAAARGEWWGPLHGVPFTLKDAHATAGVRTTSGFPPLAGHVPPADGTVAARLKAAGGILMGKTNVPVLLGDPGQTNNPIFGRTNNPWNLERTPGGSSGGAAAAVAAGLTPFDIGTDLSGSVRIPAHFCGVFGLKPTEHRVSLAGLLPGLPPPPSVRIMTCIGPLARTVDDLALLYALLAGPDGQDTDVPPLPVEAGPELALKSLRVAVAPTFPGLPAAGEMRQAITALGQQLGGLGAVVDEAALPARDVGQDLASAGELISMMLGAFQPQPGQAPATLAQYLQALGRRDESILAWEKFFDDWDVLLCPPAMTSAFPHCETGAPLRVDGQAQVSWMINGHTTLFNYTGQPAVVLPRGLDREGLPMGVQLVGRRWGEARLLAAARAVSEVSGPFRRPAGY
jgi:amidase